jgi:hypothetical protein
MAAFIILLPPATPHQFAKANYPLPAIEEQEKLENAKEGGKEWISTKGL